MITHSQFLENLIQAFPPPKPGDNALVSLVSRYKDETLKLPEEDAYVFIGDIHLLTRVDNIKYPKRHFVQNEDLKTFLLKLRELKDRWTENLKVFQLGDLFDVWRDRSSGTDEDKVDRIYIDYNDTCELLLEDPPSGADATVVAGNHDYALHKLPDWLRPRLHTIKDIDGKDRILILHGDMLDPVEKLPDWIKALAVRIATGVRSGGHIIDERDKKKDEEEVLKLNKEVVDKEGQIGIDAVELIKGDLGSDLLKPAPYNVLDGDELPEDAVSMKFFTGARDLALKLKEENEIDIRTMVIGHSHYARIIKSNRGDGEAFFLVDSGAWYGKCRLGTTDAYPWLWCGQVSFLTQNEFCIYQLGRRVTSAP